VVAEVSDALQADGINVIIEAYNACIACVYSFAPEDNA
jgi:GTP cyclohydrolase I